MEKLQELLMEYNRRHESDGPEWHRQFCLGPFPRYWSVVYDILASKQRGLSVAEVGCGYGDVAAIPLYLGYTNVVAFERDEDLASRANQKFASLFSRRVALAVDARQATDAVDVLIMVNCVYADGVGSGKDYLERLRALYERFGRPSTFIYEGVTFAPEKRRDVFPEYVWVDSSDIAKTFPESTVRESETYCYPNNSSSKRIFNIERRIA